MVFRQIHSADGTGTLSYVIGDEHTKRAVVLDPNIEDLQRLCYLADELGLHVTHVIDTHTHVDHVSAAGELKKLFGAQLIMHENTKNKWKVVDKGNSFGIGETLRANAAVEVDRFVRDDEILSIDSLHFRVLFTPGHTDNHISLLLDDKLFTGDLLLIGQAGRSDLPGGDPGEQYDSLFHKILTLPDYVKIYPGHDYAGGTFSPLSEERRSNPFLVQRTKEEYLAFVRDFFPPRADAEAGGKITLQCGTKRVPTSAESFHQITPEHLANMMQEKSPPYLLDVREPFELAAFGAIPGVENIAIREISRRINDLPGDKASRIVVICQSGNRSYEVAHYLTRQGYTNVHNLAGGTSAWVQSGNRVVRSNQGIGMLGR